MVKARRHRSHWQKNDCAVMSAGCAGARVEVETVGRASEQAASSNASGVFYHLWQQACARRRLGFRNCACLPADTVVQLQTL